MAPLLHNYLTVNIVYAIQLVGKERMLVDFTKKLFRTKPTLGIPRTNLTRPCPLHSVPLILRPHRPAPVNEEYILAANAVGLSLFCRD